MDGPLVSEKVTSCPEIIAKDAPRLVGLLKEMKSGLDLVRRKVEALTAKVKENQYPTGDGMSYLDAKHLLLLSYCECIVYYLLRKAKGLSIEGHPVVRSLVEIRLFLEKIRPIDKKLDYQIQKLTRAASNPQPDSGAAANGQAKDNPLDSGDALKYKPNPDMLVSKIDPDAQNGSGVYRPPRFAPTSVDEDDKVSRKEKQAMRKNREALVRSKQSTLAKELIDEIEGRPQEMRETVGAESGEITRYKAKLEKRARVEEELFTRAPVTKRDKMMEKHLRKSRNGLLGLSDFYDDVRALPLGNNSSAPDEPSFLGKKPGKKRGRGPGKRKRRS
ncbi:sas10/Utp3/C1D family [Wolffia australiana]